MTQAWNIDASHSGIHFTVRHMVVSKVRGNFGTFQGRLQYSENDPSAASVEVTIDASSIDTGVKDRDTHLRSADFLDVATHPEITYRSRSVERVGEGRLRVLGDLTIRGVSREVPLDVEIGGQAKDPWGNQRIGFSARASIERSQFGLKWNQALETGGVLVADRLDIDLEIQAVRQSDEKAA